MATTINHVYCIQTLEEIRQELIKERAKEVGLLEARYRRQLDRLDDRIRIIAAETRDK